MLFILVEILKHHLQALQQTANGLSSQALITHQHQAFYFLQFAPVHPRFTTFAKESMCLVLSSYLLQNVPLHIGEFAYSILRLFEVEWYNWMTALVCSDEPAVTLVAACANLKPFSNTPHWITVWQKEVTIGWRHDLYRIAIKLFLEEVPQHGNVEGFAPAAGPRNQHSLHLHHIDLQHWLYEQSVVHIELRVLCHHILKVLYACGQAAWI